MKTVDKYLFQALDSYPYCLEETIESLDYALSYDSKNAMALCLYGRVYAEQLFDYDKAKQCYQEALAIDINAVMVYPFYLNALLLNEDYEEASKLIDFALTVKGVHKTGIMFKKARLLERQNDIKGALAYIKQIKLQELDNSFTANIEELEARLKAKKELLKGKKESTSKKEDNAKEKKKKNRKN